MRFLIEDKKTKNGKTIRERLPVVSCHCYLCVNESKSGLSRFSDKNRAKIWLNIIVFGGDSNYVNYKQIS